MNDLTKIYRLHYRGQRIADYDPEAFGKAVEDCRLCVSRAQSSGKILTAALYFYKDMLFLYYEALGRPRKTAEPILMSGIPESGEDIQADLLFPDRLLAPLTPFLQPWPGQKGSRHWVHMYHIFYHDIPVSAEYWKRSHPFKKRRGRIAFLREDKVFSYLYYHKALVEEGLIKGDRYQSIALHENILFSYFEEPKVSVNLRKDDEKESLVLKEWIAAGPETHFIHMPEGGGENFMLLPELFAMGAEDQNFAGCQGQETDQKQTDQKGNI